MDRRLLEAARTGNVDYLLQLIQRDPSMLDVGTLSEGETPLHIASMAGHLSFVREMINLKPEFAGELNQDGFSPLHIAAAKGNTEIVRELLKVSNDLCLVQGKEKRVPLHFAAVKGRVGVIKQLLSACGNSVEEVTARGETPLHLVVKNNQFEAFQVLVEHLKTFDLEHVLNKKDDHGCTILHLAAAKKQYEVVNFVFNEHNVTKGVIEVNSLNAKGLTALDVLLLFQSEAGDLEIEKIICRAGGATAWDNILSSHGALPQSHPPEPELSNNQMVTKQFEQPPQVTLLNYFKFNKERESPSSKRNILLIIITLVTTATYQAGLNPPGGVWQETKEDISPPQYAGVAIMDSRSRLVYGVFVFCNTFGFYTSVYMIYLLTIDFPLRSGLYLLMNALILTYGFSSGTSTNFKISIAANISGIILPMLIYMVFLKKMETHFL